ncbi:MAG TPA: extracellular solute-binding protein [Candidatus Methylomirabilis sp.]|nr:extracellular solute-binding protein [Candidatus Methylomirabilis sp.]
MDAPDRSRARIPIERRLFLKTAAAAGAAAGLEGILAARRAPAFGQTAKIHLLQWVDFIPEGDAELRRQVAEYNRQMKTEVTFETINANDLQARITAAIQSGTGPDIILMLHNWPQLYANGLVDVPELCEWKMADQGPYYPHSEAAVRAGKRWLALPYGTGGILIAYRKSWFAEVGATQAPKTLEEYKKIGIALKKKGKPIGQTLGHTFGDAPAWTYPMTWAFGGMETDASGRKVVLNSKATLESVNWMVDFWKQCCDEGALAWDDTNNNRAFHAGEISATLNGASIYIFAKRNPDKIKDDKGEPMWSDISHFGIPDSPLGRTPPYKVAFSHALMKYSKNQAAAKEFLKWMHSKEQFGKWFEIEGGYSVGANTSWENSPMWDKIDEALKPFRTAPRGARMIGYAGPPTAKASEALTKYILTDMYAKAVQGMPPADAVKWAESELKKIYES